MRPLFQKTQKFSLIKGLLSVGLAAGLLAGAAASRTEAPPCEGELACERPGAAARGEGGEGAELPTDRPHLVEFTSATCPSCLKMAPIVADLERRCTDQDGTVVKIDVESPGGEALASRYRVKYLPTFVSVDAAGHEVERHEGVVQRERLSLALAEIRGRACPAL